MKNIYLQILFCFLIGNTSWAQVDVKVNVYGLFFENTYISAELFPNEKTGIEFGSGFRYRNANDGGYEKSALAIVMAKRYLFDYTEYRFDNIYVGMYLSGEMGYSIFNENGMFIRSSIKRSAITFGAMMGRRWMYNERIFMEANLGLGLSSRKEEQFFISTQQNTSTDLFLSFLIGYRFGEW